MAESPGREDHGDSYALPAYLQALIRENRRRGEATNDWETRIAAVVAALEGVLADGNS